MVEVVLGVQFGPLSQLQAPHLGLFWQALKSRYPKTQAQPPLGPVVEVFGARQPRVAGVRVEFRPLPPVPRVWFLNAEETRLIQVQQDRFLHNWRKVGKDDAYPRYEQIRTTFAEEYEAFGAFVRAEKLGLLVPNQCEVTYVNHIPCDFGEVDKVLTIWRAEYSGTFLGRPEEVRLAQRHLIDEPGGQPLGRLHVEARPAFRNEDGKPILRLILTARGAPVGQNMEGIGRFLDLGREWVVRGFAAVTTKEMHAIWGRRQ